MKHIIIAGALILAAAQDAPPNGQPPGVWLVPRPPDTSRPAQHIVPTPPPPEPPERGVPATGVQSTPSQE